MAGEAAGKLGAALFESRSSLDLLDAEARARGWSVERIADALELRPGPSERPLRWPPAPPVAKSSLPALLDDARHLRTPPTTIYRPGLRIALPACVKPDIGSLGRGFRAITTADHWQRFTDEHTGVQDYVVQPLLNGPECRLTLCANGTFASADLIERAGARSRWNDSTPTVRTGWLDDLHGVLQRVAVPVIGVDIIQDSGVAHVLDVNLAPALAVHLATASPRRLAAAVLDSWLAVGVP